MTQKATVHFDPTRKGLAPRVGSKAIVFPIDHTSALVSNTKHVLTSRVTAVNPDGSFETMNSLYVPKDPT
jgi:hypothetical protein